MFQTTAHLAILFWQLIYLAVSYSGDVKPQILLYIGPHKSASSSIEAFFLLHQNRLSKSYNYHWPSCFQDKDAGVGKATSHFADAMVHGKQTEITFQFKNYMKTARLANQNVIVASENFDAMKLDDVFKLKTEYFEGYDVKVILSYRERVSAILSMYVTNINFFHFSIETFEEYLFRHFNSMERNVGEFIYHPPFIFK